MNNIFINFIKTIKDPVKIFNTKLNIQSKKQLNHDIDDIIFLDKEPILYNNFINNSHIIKIFDEYEYPNDFVNKYKKQTKSKNNLLSNNEVDVNNNNDTKLIIRNISKLKCKTCKLCFNSFIDKNIIYYKNSNRYFIANNIQYNRLKWIYQCGCEI